MPDDAAPRWVLVAGAALAGGIVLLDLVVPPGIAIGMLHVVPILLGLWAPRSRYVAVVVACATVFTIIGAFVPWPAHLWRLVLVNRILTLVGLWIAGFVVTWHHRLQLRHAEMQRLRD